MELIKRFMEFHSGIMDFSRGFFCFYVLIKFTIFPLPPVSILYEVKICAKWRREKNRRKRFDDRIVFNAKILLRSLKIYCDNFIASHTEWQFRKCS